MILFYSIPCLFLLVVIHAEKICDAETGVCRLMEATKRCQLHSSWCASTLGKGEKYGSSSSSSLLYRYGGSAQAYKPQAPIKTSVCDNSTFFPSSAIASWPFSRGSMKSPPRLVFHVTLWSCGGSSSSSNSKPSSPENKNAENCCCQLLSAASTSSNNHTTVEIWQARPDGSYSSLRPDTQEGDCRARMIVSNDATTATTSKHGMNVVTFTTLPPGSTGCLSGLGPGGWDTFPYGPPKLHMLVTSPGHAPTLVDIPISFHRKTWEQKQGFWGPDWRGVAWMHERPAAPAYHITNWKPNVKQGLIDIDLDLFLQVWDQETDAATTLTALDDVMFCPSWIYGLPWSFFLQPMRICAPALLDFFAL